MRLRKQLHSSENSVQKVQFSTHVTNSRHNDVIISNTLVGSGHVPPRIWEITNKRLEGGGGISVRFVSTKRIRRDQWKLRIRPCSKGSCFLGSTIGLAGCGLGYFSW